MFSAEIFIELIESIETLPKDHLESREDRTREIERIMFAVIFPSGFQDSEVFEVFEFTSDSIDLFIYITTELSDEEVFLGIKCMLQEEFFEEFFSTV
jgi:quinolinate synthase